LERNLFMHVYDRLFSVSVEDTQLTAEIATKGPQLSYRHFFIPEKYSNQVPWQLALDEISKKNIYKAPQDKINCIINCWNIIFTYTRPFGIGSIGADDFLPIMAFVLLAARPPYLLSNIQYILLYTTLDAEQEVWIMNLLSAVEIVKEVLCSEKPRITPTQGWTNGKLTHDSSTQKTMTPHHQQTELFISRTPP